MTQKIALRPQRTNRNEPSFAFYLAFIIGAIANPLVPPAAAQVQESGRWTYSRLLPSGANEIFTSSANGTGEAQITRLGGLASASTYSPDGTKIITNQCLMMDANGANIKSVPFPAPASPGSTNCRYSSDRTKIVGIGVVGGKVGVVMMNIDFSGFQFVNPPFPSSPFPAILHNPDVFGSKVVISVNQQIATVNTDGTGFAYLPIAYQTVDPSFSRDGTKIVFSDGYDSPSNIFIANVDGSGLTNLTSAYTGLQGGVNVNASGPRFSPLGSKIIFALGPATPTGPHVTTMNPDGSNLTTYGNIGYDPDWGVAPGTPLPPPSPTPPTAFNLLTPASGTIIPTSTPLLVTFSWSASADSNSGIASYSLLLDNVNVSTVSGASTSTSILVPIGRHTWTVVAKNGAGLTTTASSVSALTLLEAGGRWTYSRIVTTGANEIFTSSADGTGDTQITKLGGYASGPTYSPDGTKIITSQCLMLQANGVNVQPVPFPAQVSGTTNCRYSSDKTKIVGVGVVGGQVGIVLMNLDYSGFQFVNPPFTSNLVRGPDVFGTKILVTVNQLLATLNINGTGFAYLPITYQTQNPSFSRDGTKFVFSDGLDTPSNVFIANADGSGLTNLTNARTGLQGGVNINASNPRFSPQGSQIIFALGPGTPTGPHVTTMNLDGSSTTVSANVGYDPDWGSTPVTPWPQAFDLLTPANGTTLFVTGSSTVTFSWSASADPVSGISNYALLLDNIVAKTIPGTNTSTSIVVPLGQHTWTVQATNGRGQITAANSISTVTLMEGDGRWAYSRIGPSSSNEIFISSSDGTGDTQVTALGGYASGPTFSPDGTKLITNQCLLMDANGFNVQPVPFPAQVSGAINCRYSSDKSKIVAVGMVGGQVGVVMMKIDYTGFQFVNPPFTSNFIRNPDVFGSKIVLAVNQQLATVNVDGTGLSSLPITYQTQNPSFSRDGAKIVFSNGFDTPSNIFIVNVDGTGLRNLTNALTGLQGGINFNAANPRFSPQGSKIIFALGPATPAGPHVATMNPDGSGVVVSNIVGYDPDWGIAPSINLPLPAVSYSGSVLLLSNVSNMSISSVTIASPNVSIALASASASGLVLVSPIYDITPSVPFSPPARLVFNYNPAIVTDISTLAIYRFDGVSWSSSAVSNQVVSVNGSNVSGQLAHSSFYALFVRDTVPPSLTIVPTNGSTTTTAIPSLYAIYADTGSGVHLATVLLVLDGVDVTAQSVITISSASFVPSSALSQGTHTITSQVADFAGNQTALTSMFFIDSIPPVTTLAVNGAAVPAITTNLILVSTDSLSFTATDGGTGVAQTLYTVDGSSEIVFVSTFSLTVGTHTLTFHSRDNAGNLEALKNDFITVHSTVTILPPTVSLTFPSPKALGVEQSLGGAINIRGSVYDANLLSWTLAAAPGVSVSSGFTTIASGAANVSGQLAAWNTSALSGYFTLKLSAVNATGGTAVATAPVFVGKPVLDYSIGKHDANAVIASLKNPQGLVVRPDGLIWIAVDDDSKLLLVTSSGSLVASVGAGQGNSDDHGHDGDHHGDDGDHQGRDQGNQSQDSSTIRFSHPRGLSLDTTGNLYVADRGRDRVIKLSIDGSRLIAEFISGLKGPNDAVVDADGSVYVADTGNQRVRVFAANGAVLRDIPTGSGRGESQPWGIALTSQGLWVSDRAQKAVYLFTRQGSLLKTLAGVGRVRGASVDHTEALYVVERDEDRVRKFDPLGSALLAIGSRGEEDDEGRRGRAFLSDPSDVAIGPDGALWVADSGHDRIVRYELPATGGGNGSVALNPTTNTKAPAARAVDPTDGGKVERDDGTGVRVPPNALPSALQLSVQSADTSRDVDAKRKKRLANGIAPASEEVEYGPEGTQFQAPVTITIPYDPTQLALAGITDDQLKIHYWNPTRGDWEALPSTVDKAAKTVSALTTHFSVYQVMGPGIGVAAADATFGLKAAYVFPNPVRGTSAATIRIQPGLADSVEVHIYDLSGLKLHSSSAFTLSTLDDGNGLGAQFTYDHVWDVSGVGSGVYTYVITARKAGQSDIHKTGKIGVVK